MTGLARNPSLEVEVPIGQKSGIQTILGVGVSFLHWMGTPEHLPFMFIEGGMGRREVGHCRRRK